MVGESVLVKTANQNKTDFYVKKRRVGGGCGDMENKCNSNYLDHVYCHSDSKNYMRTNHNNNAGGQAQSPGSEDFLPLLKENKQLKTMLILHLDLIQEQGDQLIAKDKELMNQNGEVERLRARCVQLESQVGELQKQLQRQLKRAASASTGEMCLLSPPPLAKIQCRTERLAPTKTIIGECNGQLISKIMLQRVEEEEQAQLGSQLSLASDTASEAEDHQHKLVLDAQHEFEEEEVEEESYELAHIEDGEESNDDASTVESHHEQADVELEVTPQDKPQPKTPLEEISSPNGVAPTKGCSTASTPSRGKQMPVMMWHSPYMHSDESFSCDSLADTEGRTPSATSRGERQKSIDEAHKLPSNVSEPSQHTHGKRRRHPYLTTPNVYCAREWETENAVCDFEFTKEEAGELHADAPMLEIPKWTEHEILLSHSVEGTEDLSDELFLKRHSKLEVDERRRKKWDVQQIREQRRIEKLKRRHCKQDVHTSADQQQQSSFYPKADEVQTIYYVKELPVQAFGEVIPQLSASTPFTLPWIDEKELHDTTSTVTECKKTSTAINVESNNASATSPKASNAKARRAVSILAEGAVASTSARARRQTTASSFMFARKTRRRLSSSSATHTSTRQRAHHSVSGASKAVTQTTTSSTGPIVTPVASK